MKNHFINLSLNLFRCLVCSLSSVFIKTFGEFLNEIQKAWDPSLGKFQGTDYEG